MTADQKKDFIGNHMKVPLEHVDSDLTKSNRDNSRVIIPDPAYDKPSQVT